MKVVHHFSLLNDSAFSTKQTALEIRQLITIARSKTD